MKRLIFYLSLLSVVGCHNGADVEAFAEESSRIPFEFSLSEQPYEGSNSSRATIATTVSSAGLYGYRPGVSLVYIDNAQINSNGEFELADRYYWPSSVKEKSTLDFIAYSPYVDPNSSDSDSGISNVASTSATNLTLNYSVPEAVASQPDLMVASTKGITNESDVDLTFSHALTAVKFAVEGSPNPVTEVTFSSIYTAGELTYDGTTSAWTQKGDKSDVTYTNLTAEDNYLMMVPQTLSAAETEITYTQNGTTKKLKLKSDLTWLPGYEYTFTVSFLKDYVEVDYTNRDDSNCYILNPKNIKQVFYIPIEGRINTFWGNKGYADEPNNMILDGDEWEVDILWSDIESTDDLTSDGFKVERVTEGFANTTYSSALKVTLPAIFYNNTEKDTNGNPKMHGNIVVGVRNDDYSNDQDNYSWSWHFWITDYDPDKAGVATTAATSFDGVVADVPKGNVFQYKGESFTSKDGDNYMKYIMDRPIGALQVFSNTTMYQSARTILYYQYGRKDPFSLYHSGIYSDYYNKDDNNDHNIINERDKGTIARGVMSPAKFDSSDSQGVTSSEKDLDYKQTSMSWNDKKADNESEKSIFDPSPLGWKVAPIDTWSDFNFNKTAFFNENKNAIKYEVKGSNYAYYPAAGYLRCGVGSLPSTNKVLNGYYWSCSPFDGSYEEGAILYFSSKGEVYSSNNTYRGYGSPVIAVQE